jgi:hypothetical protein
MARVVFLECEAFAKFVRRKKGKLPRFYAKKPPGVSISG